MSPVKFTNVLAMSRILSTAKAIPSASIGIPTAIKTLPSIINDPLGTGATPKSHSAHIIKRVVYCELVNSIFSNCAMKIVIIAKYIAPPLELIAALNGATKFVFSSLTPNLSFAICIPVGSAAEELAVRKAINCAGKSFFHM